MSTSSTTSNRLINLLRPYWFRGKGRLLNALVPHKGEREALVFGYKIKLNLEEYIQRNIYLGTYEPSETAILIKNLKPGMTFIDVGANVGYFTALASTLVGTNGKVLAIEPSPYAVEKLRLLVDQNKISQVEIIQAGLSSTPGKMNLYLNKDSKINHTPTMVNHEEGIPQTVDVYTLDELVIKYNLNQIDLLKIDIEGFELEAFKGAKKTLSERKIKSILCEFNDYWLRQAKTSPQELYDFLINNGFKSYKNKPNFKNNSTHTYFFNVI